MIKKIILAVTFGVLFVVTFAAGIGFIIAGAGDFSWDIVSQYVSMSEITMINDTPISSLFSFSDHTDMVGSHAEGQIGCPTQNGTITLSNIAEEVTLTASPDEFIHLTVDGKLRDSCVVETAKNLTGKNIPDIQFEYNESTDEAIVKIRKLRGKDIKMEIAIPESFGGTLKMEKIAGKLDATIALHLVAIDATGVAGNITTDGISAASVSIKDVAGKTVISNGQFNGITIDDCAGKIEVSGGIGWFKLSSVMGTIKLDSNISLTKNCSITNVMGSVDIKLPEGSKFKLVKEDIVGIVLPAKGDKKADFTVTVKNVTGKVSIDR